MLIAAPEIPADLQAMLEGDMDFRLRLLSHSSRSLLHSCPRKYQLYRLGNPAREYDEHTDFGTVVGEGIQHYMLHGDFQAAVFRMFTLFRGDLFEDGVRSRKTFLHAVYALKQFQIIKNTLLADYEVATFNDRPALELGFSVSVGNEFAYRGKVDIILRNKLTGLLLVLELKTSKDEAKQEKYGNAGQGLGYSIFTRQISPAADKFNVLYLVYQTMAQEFAPLMFVKQHTERALWIQDLIADCQLLGVYNQFEVWPRHGESCMSFNRPCNWYGMCHMRNSNLFADITDEERDKVLRDETNYTFRLDITSLLTTQITEIHQ